MQTGNQVFKPINKGIKRPQLGCVFALLPIAGAILAVVGGWFLFTSWAFYSKGVKVEGTVVRLESSQSTDGVTYTAVFSYAVDGQSYEVMSGTASDPPLYQKGDVVTLLYDPDNPKSARENSFWDLWGLSLILCPVSIFMLALSILIPLLVRRMPGA
jgi:hypothetical protein